MVWATSDTERPVPRYLFTCLQFTVPANPGPAVPSNSATPIASVPSFMREPPCACAQPLDADRAARGTPGDCIATPRREGKLRRPAPSRPARAGHWARTGRRSRDMGMRAGVMMMLSVAGPALAAAPMLDRIDVAGDEAPAVRLHLSAPVSATAHHLPAGAAAPARIYIDLSGAALGAALPHMLAGAAPVVRVRASQFDPTTVRVVLDLERRVPFVLRQTDETITLELEAPAAIEPPALTPTAAAPEPPAPPPDPPATRAPPPTPPPPAPAHRPPYPRTDRRGTRAAPPAGAPRSGRAVTEPAAIDPQGEAAHRGSSPGVASPAHRPRCRARRARPGSRRNRRRAGEGHRARGDADGRRSARGAAPRRGAADPHRRFLRPDRAARRHAGRRGHALHLVACECVQRSECAGARGVLRRRRGPDREHTGG